MPRIETRPQEMPVGRFGFPATIAADVATTVRKFRFRVSLSFEAIVHDPGCLKARMRLAGRGKTIGPMNEKRNAPRRRILKAGTISFGAAAGIDCVVRNLSETGALLAVESSVGVPNTFTLVVLSEKLKRKVEVKWRRARSIGVAFA